MSPKMIRETYAGNLPYVEGYKVLLCEPGERRNICNMWVDSGLLNQKMLTNQENSILNWLAKKSLTTIIYLSADEKGYSTRHALAKRLESIRNKIIEEKRDATRRVCKNQ